MNRKPVVSIEKIGLSVKESPVCYAMHLKKNQRIDFQSHQDNGNIYFLECGSVSFFRLSDDVLTINMKSPSMIGLTQLRETSRFHYFRCDEESVLWVIRKPDFEALLNENSYWEHAYNILSYITVSYHERDIMTSRGNVRMIVIDHLLRLWELMVQEGEVHSIYKYILSRNNLSRSAVHKVICDLSSEGSISVYRGKLIMLDELQFR